MGTNCAPLLADIFLYSYEAEFIQSLVSDGKRYLASNFNFTYRYIGDVLSINNPKFADYLSSIYPSELEVKETTETNNSASYLDIMLSYDTDGHLNTSLYDKRDDFNFNITNNEGSRIAVKALESVNGKRFDYGNTASTIYIASGCSTDWAYGEAGVKYSYAVELRDTGEYGFFLPSDQIVPTGNETLEALIALANYVHDH
ncbi:hypothetical protein FSP39_011818 [Pinctada imbricata]|uniref:Peptidase M14 domain-containing protein n=1 Tax=Pinctada imbricata TaxID=66713 RepID=A0AA89BKK2_PINIB|nr:hypothetical protein FSP39_011818 [Pinctada imbricata]